MALASPIDVAAVSSEMEEAVKAEIASLKQRLESAEALLRSQRAVNPRLPVREGALQEMRLATVLSQAATPGHPIRQMLQQEAMVASPAPAGPSAAEEPPQQQQQEATQEQPSFESLSSVSEHEWGQRQALEALLEAQMWLSQAQLDALRAGVPLELLALQEHSRNGVSAQRDGGNALPGVTAPAPTTGISPGKTPEHFDIAVPASFDAVATVNTNKREIDKVKVSAFPDSANQYEQVRHGILSQVVSGAGDPIRALIYVQEIDDPEVTFEQLQTTLDPNLRSIDMKLYTGLMEQLKGDRGKRIYQTIVSKEGHNINTLFNGRQALRKIDHDYGRESLRKRRDALTELSKLECVGHDLPAVDAFMTTLKRCMNEVKDTEDAPSTLFLQCMVKEQLQKTNRLRPSISAWNVSPDKTYEGLLHLIESEVADWRAEEQKKPEKPAAAAGKDPKGKGKDTKGKDPKGKGKGKDKGKQDTGKGQTRCWTCGKTRDEHENRRFCPYSSPHAAAAAERVSPPSAQAQPSPKPTAVTQGAVGASAALGDRSFRDALTGYMNWRSSGATGVTAASGSAQQARDRDQRARHEDPAAAGGTAIKHHNVAFTALVAAMCSAVVTSTAIIDSGGSFHLVDERNPCIEWSTLQEGDARSLQCIGKVTHINQIADVSSDAMGPLSQCYVGPWGIDAFSLGQLIAQGWRFTWDDFSNPELFKPDGAQAPLQVHQYVPYCVLQPSACVAMDECADLVVACVCDEIADELFCYSSDIACAAAPLHAHSLLHIPADPECEICTVAKLKEDPHRRRKAEESYLHYATEFNEKVSWDLVSAGVADRNGNNYLFTHQDEHTGWIELDPIPDKASDTTSRALLRAQAGKGWPQRGHSDWGGEWGGAFQDLLEQNLVKIEKGIPYDPQSDSRHERLHHTTNQMIRAVLEQSGLPVQYWGDAARYVRFVYNRTFVVKRTGCTPFFKRYGRDYDHPRRLHAFGCRVAYLPTHAVGRTKFESRGRWGLFLGYRGSGYLIMDTTAEEGLEQDVPRFQIVRTCRFNDDIFPAVQMGLRPLALDLALQGADEASDPDYLPDDADATDVEEAPDGADKPEERAAPFDTNVEYSPTSPAESEKDDLDVPEVIDYPPGLGPEV